MKDYYLKPLQYEYKTQQLIYFQANLFIKKTPQHQNNQNNL